VILYRNDIHLVTDVRVQKMVDIKQANEQTVEQLEQLFNCLAFPQYYTQCRLDHILIWLFISCYDGCSIIKENDVRSLF